MKTGREDDHQLPVPNDLRAVVSARYGVEIIQQGGHKYLIISDQLHDRHVDLRYPDIGTVAADAIEPMIRMLTDSAKWKAA